MVAHERLERRLEILRDNLADLRRYASRIPPGGLSSDRDAQHMVLHALYVATQAAIDAGSHVLADRGLPRATTYAAVFERLAEAGVLSRDLAERMAGWAGMRNVVAHFYPVIDLGRVERALRQDLGDFDDFLAAVEQLVSGSD
ncbi:MAG: DUF86 domain-containing protein [Myxococcota bacterium]|nr:DUF86 domain-containing protein [Myxococcota bacterium]